MISLHLINAKFIKIAFFMFISVVKCAIRILEDMKKKGATVRETETNIKIFYRLIHCFRFR